MGLTRSPTGISWDLLEGIREKYLEFYGRQIQVKQNKESVGNFDEVLGQALMEN